jgi:hypothetical protein
LDPFGLKIGDFEGTNAGDNANRAGDEEIFGALKFVELGDPRCTGEDFNV